MNPTSNSLSLPLQGTEDVNGDFYVKENQNGTIMFESVAFPGKYAHMLHGKGKQKVQLCEFSVFLLVGAMGSCALGCSYSRVHMHVCIILFILFNRT